MNQAITQMDQVTQQNAALVEEAAAAADSLQGQAAGLPEIVSVFRVGGVSAAHKSTRKKPSVAPKVVKLAPPAPRRGSAPSPVTTRKATANGADEWEEF